MASTTHEAGHGADALAAAAEHGSGGMPQFDFSTWASQIFWVAIALFILYRVLVKSILPRISTTLEERHNAIVDDLDQAAEYKRKAEEAEQAYEAALADARTRAQKIAAETKAEIDAEVAQAVEKADADIAVRTEASESRINEIRASADANVREVAQDAAEAILAKLMPGAVDKDAIARALDVKLAGKG